MALTPLEPSAGPTGGAGAAWPAPTINLIITFLADMLGDEKFGPVREYSSGAADNAGQREVGQAREKKGAGQEMRQVWRRRICGFFTGPVLLLPHTRGVSQ